MKAVVTVVVDGAPLDVQQWTEQLQRAAVSLAARHKLKVENIDTMIGRLARLAAQTSRPLERFNPADVPAKEAAR